MREAIRSDYSAYAAVIISHLSQATRRATRQGYIKGEFSSCRDKRIQCNSRYNSINLPISSSSRLIQWASKPSQETVDLPKRMLYARRAERVSLPITPYPAMERLSLARIRLSRFAFMGALCAILHGCVGLGAWTLGSRTESSESPHIYQVRGSLNVQKEGREGDIKTGTELRTNWGEPDQITAKDDGKEEWIYKTNGWRWHGIVLYAVIVPLPAMVPWGTQYVSVLVKNGQIERATRVDWNFIAGAYCGYFLMMQGWGCGAGTF